MNQYNSAIAEYKDAASKADDEYKNTASQYTGNEGYKNSVQQAKGTAQQLTQAQTQQAANAASTAARNSGMSKAQAAATGSQNVAGTYNSAYANNFNTQQQQVASQGQAAVNAAETNANNVKSTYGQTANMYGNAASIASGEYANEFNRNQTQISNWTLGLGTLSDARLKDYRKIGDKVARHKKLDFDSLKIKQGE